MFAKLHEIDKTYDWAKAVKMQKQYQMTASIKMELSHTGSLYRMQ